MQRQVVGVVADIKQHGLAEPSTPTVYYYSRARDWSLATIVVRTSTPPTAFARPVVAAIHDIRTMEEVLDSTLTPQRFSAGIAIRPKVTPRGLTQQPQHHSSSPAEGRDPSRIQSLIAEMTAGCSHPRG